MLYDNMLYINALDDVSAAMPIQRIPFRSISTAWNLLGIVVGTDVLSKSVAGR